MSVAFPCPYCSKPVYPEVHDAVMNPATKQWQHLDCCPEAIAASRGLRRDARQ